MARACRLLIFVALATISSAWSQTPPPSPATPPERQKRSEKGGKKSPELDNVRKAIDALSPQQRKRFQENFWRWTNLSHEEKKSLRDRDESRRKRMAEQIEAAIKETGLELDKERRELFAKRYAEERRRIEEQLRREMDEKRTPLLNDLVGRLKTEFSATPSVP